MTSESYVVAGIKTWNARLFEERLVRLPGRWTFIGDPSEMTVEHLSELEPRYVFFLHWSTKVPLDITGRFECVVFHMTDVPFGRGGSPLQNLITQGHETTVVSALWMTQDLDAGPVYLKRPLSLEGGAEEILIRAGSISADMIQEIIAGDIRPNPQEGEAVVFSRRFPEESEIGEHADLTGLFDFIRMLDAEGYPRAFVDRAGFRYEFSRPALYDGRIVADVNITPLEEDR